MIIKLNNETIRTPHEEMTLLELLGLKNIPVNGTAIARNGRLVPRTKWDMERLEENDDIVVISAAYGG